MCFMGALDGEVWDDFINVLLKTVASVTLVDISGIHEIFGLRL